MSGSLRQFAVTSLLGMLMVSAALVLSYHHLSRTNLLDSLARHNHVLAVFLRNDLEADGLIHMLDDGDPGVSSQALDMLDAELRAGLRWVPVVKVKVYNRHGKTVFSTQRSQIGEDASGNHGVRMALLGQSMSDLVERHRFNAWDGIREDLDLHQHYIPIRSPHSGEVEGVFEIYSDVSETLLTLSMQQRRVFAGIVAILALFYLALFMLFRRNDIALGVERRERENDLEQLEVARSELESRVLERTRELEQSHVFLQSIIDGIGNPLVVIRPDFTIGLMNKAARDLIPAGADMAEYRYCYQISHRRDKPCEGAEHPCAFHEVMRHCTASRVRHTHYDSAGAPILVDILSTPLFGPDGEFEGVIEVHHDVTQIVRMQEGLMASEMRLHAIMDNVPDAIVTCAGDGTIESMNRAAAFILGASEEQVIGRALSTFVAGTDRLHELADTTVFQDDVIVRREGGDEFPGEIWIGQMPGEDNGRYIAVVRDITARREAEQELERTRQEFFHQEKMAAIGQLAAGILHEVGNPIAAIAGAAAELEDVTACGYRPDSECPFDVIVARNVSLIDEQTVRLSRITREIADFASPRPRERELLDLNSLLQSTVRLLRYDRRFRDVRMDLELDKNLPAITGVADQLTQLFMNLLINAMDACTAVPDRESVIRIETTIDGDRVQVAVADNGCGMNPEVQAHATDPFYTTKPVGKGTGLGLSLCDSIAHSHGGVMLIESTPGEGSAINVYLPIEIEREVLPDKVTSDA